MALQIHYPSLSLTLIPKPYRLLRSQFTVKSQSNQPTPGPTDADSQADSQPKKLGFGSAAASPAPAKDTAKKKQRKGRASIIRRAPIENPPFSEVAKASAEEEAKAREMGRNESAFLLAWLGLGAIILVEGIALAASGFLPEAWDKFFVKYLYPSFTPTVGLFVAGTVTYGVSKYLQNEKLKDQK